MYLPMSAWSVEIRGAPFRHCRDARVHGHYHASHEYHPPPSLPPDCSSMMISYLAHFSDQPVATKHAAKIVSMEENNKIIRAPLAPQSVAPVRKGTVFTKCGIPSLFTCNELLPSNIPMARIYTHTLTTNELPGNSSEQQ